MQAKAQVGMDQVKKARIDHHPRPGRPLLRRLEDQVHIGAQPSIGFRPLQEQGRTGQSRRVKIMPAGMHDPLIPGLPGALIELGLGKGVDIRAEHDLADRPCSLLYSFCSDNYLCTFHTVSFLYTFHTGTSLCTFVPGGCANLRGQTPVPVFTGRIRKSGSVCRKLRIFSVVAYSCRESSGCM